MRSFFRVVTQRRMSTGLRDRKNGGPVMEESGGGNQKYSRLHYSRVCTHTHMHIRTHAHTQTYVRTRKNNDLGSVF